MVRWLCALVTSAVITGFALLLVTGRYRKEGPVLATVAPQHGIHAGDVLVLLGWALAMAAVLVLTMRAKPRCDHRV